MTDLLLARDPSQVSDAVTFGTLSLGGFQTLELPWRPWVQMPSNPDEAAFEWRGGLPGKSCIEPGIYELVRHNTPKHPFTWALVNPELGVWHEPGDIPAGEQGRSTVLIHPGNTALDTEGCILLGLERTMLWQPPGVMESVKAFQALRANLPWTDGHTLTITGEGSQ